MEFPPFEKGGIKGDLASRDVRESFFRGMTPKRSVGGRMLMTGHSRAEYPKDIEAGDWVRYRRG